MTHALSIFARRPVLTGIAVGVVTMAPHFFLTPAASVSYAGVVIALIAGIYFGFAVMNGSPRDQFVEFNVAGMFAVAGILGILVWPVVLPFAYFAHAAWDLDLDHLVRPSQLTATSGQPAIGNSALRAPRRPRKADRSR